MLPNERHIDQHDSANNSNMSTSGQWTWINKEPWTIVVVTCKMYLLISCPGPLDIYHALELGPGWTFGALSWSRRWPIDSTTWPSILSIRLHGKNDDKKEKVRTVSFDSSCYLLLFNATAAKSNHPNALLSSFFIKVGPLTTQRHAAP